MLHFPLDSPPGDSTAGRRRMPITVIGGFLGAGKTTLLNALLRQAGDRRVAVLVNDFGELNIDARLVVAVAGETVELANGCICCTIRDDLVDGVQQLLDRDPPPEHILIETSGVSDPLNISFTFLASKLRERCRIDNVVTVVDAVHAGDARLAEYWHLFERQIDGAYVVVLNKTALAGAERTEWTRRFIEGLVPDAQIVETADGTIPLPWLIDDARLGQRPFRPMPQLDTSPHPFATVALRSERPLVRHRFVNFLAGLRGAAFRAKGVLQLERQPGATVFQMVGRLQSFEDGPPWHGRAPASELVLIGDPAKLHRDALAAGLRDCEAA